MKNNFKKELLFIIPSKQELPFNDLNHLLSRNYNLNYNLIETSYYRFGNNKKEIFKVFRNDKCIYYKKEGSYENQLLSIAFHFYFSVKESLIFIKSFLKKKHVIIITQGLKCFAIGLIAKKILRKKIKLVSFHGDIINEDYKFFGTGLLNNIKNFFFIFLQKILRKLLLKSDLIIYESLKLLKYDKKISKTQLKYILIEPSLIQEKNNFFNTKYRRKYNIISLGNIINDGHLEFLYKLYKLSKGLIKVHIVGGDTNMISDCKKKFPFFKFYGYIRNPNKINNIIKICSFGSAFYNIATAQKKIIPSGKINFYVTNNLPILSSIYSYENKDINKSQIGIASNNPKKVWKFINKCSNINYYTKIMSNLERFKKNKNYDFHMNIVLNKILNFF
jgi:hypothetical protein